MRIPNRPGLSGLLLAVIVAAVAPAGAAEVLARAPAVLAAEQFGSAKEALRVGVRQYGGGDKAGAAEAFEYAARQGNMIALWKLGRMNADGDGIPKSDLRAFEYFTRVASDNADEPPESPRASLVANAFVSLGNYLLSGIPGTAVRPDPERAAEMFSYAAMYFGDPSAQFSLGRLYLEGTGIGRDERQAARWLNLAAEKGFGPAQALLGRILIKGEGVPPERARGLMWLMLAQKNADPQRDPWIASLHAEALEAASESERRAAIGYVEKFQPRKR